MKKIIAVAILFGISCSAHAEKMYANVGFGQQSDFGTGVLVAGGMEVTKMNNIPVAAEIGYQSFGSKDYFGTSVSAHATYIAAVGSYTIGNNLNAIGKLGLTSKSAEAATPFGKVSASESGLMFGIGIEYEFQKNMAVGADYTDYDGDAVIGARVKFGF